MTCDEFRRLLFVFQGKIGKGGELRQFYAHAEDCAPCSDILRNMMKDAVDKELKELNRKNPELPDPER